MTVAIDQHQVIARDHGVPDDLVRGRCPVDDEKSVIGAEVARRPGFCFCQRPGVIQQRPQLRHRHRQIRTQGVFPEKLVKRLTHGALVVGHATTMPRRVPGIVGVCRVLHQRLEKGRQQAIEVFARSPRHLTGEKRHGVFEQIKNPAQLIELGHGVGGGVFQGDLLAQGEDRQVRRAHSRQPDQLGHIL